MLFIALANPMTGLATGTLDTLNNIIYNEDYPILDGMEMMCKLDIFIPDKDDERNVIPVFLIHGCAYTVWYDKGSMEPICQYLRHKGYTVFNIEYEGRGFLPLGLRKKGYKATQSIAAAIKYVLTMSDEFAINPDQATLIGVSAGGISSLFLGLYDELNDQEYSLFKDLEDQFGGIYSNSPFISTEVKPAAVVSIGSALPSLDIIDFTDLEETSFLMIHGEEDEMVSIDEDTPFGAIGDSFNEGLRRFRSNYSNRNRTELTEALVDLFEPDKLAEDLIIPDIFGSRAIVNRMVSINPEAVDSLFLNNEDHSMLFGERRNIPKRAFINIMEKIDVFIQESTLKYRKRFTAGDFILHPTTRVVATSIIGLGLVILFIKALIL